MTTHTPAPPRAATLVVLFLVTPGIFSQNSATTANPHGLRVGAKAITVWKVGDPYTGGTPDTAVPPTLELAAEKLGYDLRVEAFPIRGFASLFFRAFENHQPPDILVFNYNGVLEGGSTPIGSVTGIGSDPEIHAALLRVTESLGALEARSWQYLIRTSPNFEAARTLALRPPECGASADAALPQELSEIAMRAARAYLENDPSLRNLEDPDRLHTSVREPKERRVETVKACGYWGTDHLAFVPAIASYTSPGTIGWVSRQMVFRKLSDQWRLLAASTDPVSNKSFVSEIPAIVSLITKTWTPGNVPEPPSILSPPDGQYPAAAPGNRFGDFSWHPSPSSGEVAEVIEFAYNDDARLITVFFSGPAPATEHCSAGLLWHSPGTWRWRVWSISESGSVSFSQPRSFTE
ncbi:MAG: hypothetical protein ABSE79_22730 [Terriglobia bacterium]